MWETIFNSWYVPKHANVIGPQFLFFWDLYCFFNTTMGMDNGHVRCMGEYLNKCKLKAVHCKCSTCVTMLAWLQLQRSRFSKLISANMKSEHRIMNKRQSTLYYSMNKVRLIQFCLDQSYWIKKWTWLLY